MAAYCSLLLEGSEPEVREVPEVRRNDAQQEIRTIYQLLDKEGWNSVNLDRAAKVLGRPERTSARRLAEARKQYAAELSRRAGRSRREADIDTVYDLICELGDPRSVSLEDVMERLDLKQTTAFDRLDAARKRWASENT
ncbi:hypothetical protein IQ62_01735 [Streptomyces scabiei]|uniref:hypothetical protein n=1 Tax=Streptomyces scabiei TaxID=1930 RepID=UPI0004E6F10E|nr:hypothetical protein [Streptomyces scabiei]KFG02489.1 hypothetical protein IQ62_01735 [Streptomyces scabiei]